MFHKDSNPWQLVTFLLIGLIAGYGVSYFAGAPDTTESETTQEITITPEQEADTVVDVGVDDDAGLGDPDAPVVIVEFSDFQCFYCRRFYNDTYTLLKENYVDKGLVYLVYRDFPLASIHPDAQKAAEAAECAAEQDKFWEMHDMIFDGQNALGSGTVSIPMESLKEYAVELGLDAEDFNACLDDGDQADEVNEDIHDALKYEVTATPTFFINGHLVVGARSYETLAGMIDSLLVE